MTAVPATDWHTANQRHLVAALLAVREALQRHAASHASGNGDHAPTAVLDEGWAYAQPPALDLLTAAFALSPFERDTLVLCAGMELEAAFADLCAAAQGTPDRAFPTFGLALAALPGAHWSALTPEAPLRRWRLIEIAPGAALTLSPLRIDETVLHYLAGAPHLDERLSTLLRAVAPPMVLSAQQRGLAARIAAIWSHPTNERSLPAIHLLGGSAADRRTIVAAATEMLDLPLYLLDAAAVPAVPGERSLLGRLWTREAFLSGRCLLIELDTLDGAGTGGERAVVSLLDELPGIVSLSSRERGLDTTRRTLHFDVAPPASHERRAIWHDVLGSRAQALNGYLEGLVAQFHLGTESIQAAADAASCAGTGELGASLWEACRMQARPRLDGLAQRIEPVATWADLVLPLAQTELLHNIATHVRARATVYDTWGFAGKGERGLGISALFAGASGTGKTLAAEVLAHELALDLYRIDLSQVVSKYIGETERNLARIFDAAESGGAILLFDEADALFGKRSEVKDSHDRYANIEVSYLLQRMETYRGLAILTTNMKSALDTAFLRRLRFVVQFPFPDAMQREEIWRRIFPEATPTSGLRPPHLARLNVAGGNIRNIALSAAFLAAGAGQPVGMEHLLRAARAEYAKLEKPLTEKETGGWL